MKLSLKIPVIYHYTEKHISDDTIIDDVPNEIMGYIYFNTDHLRKTLVRIESYIENGELVEDRCEMILTNDQSILICLSDTELIKMLNF